jgi:hypothetical protein
VSLNKSARAEINLLMKEGKFNPKHILEFARSENSALHKFFVWDDTEAAEKYRLIQAQRLIIRYELRVVKPEGDPVTIRQFVSLTTERQRGGGSYRTVEDVMADSALRAQMFTDAKASLASLRRKYAALQELAAVWREIDAALASEEGERLTA